VNNFCRLPTLSVAAGRRFCAALVAAFFDDFAALGLAFQRGASQQGLSECLKIIGASPAAHKHYPMTQQRVWLGAFVNLGTVNEEKVVTLASKEGAVQKLTRGIADAISQGKLSSGTAAKLRGQANWLATNAAGRCGRLGISVLAAKQKATDDTLSYEQVSALQFLAKIAENMPDRKLRVHGAEKAPVLLYTDASVSEAAPLEPIVGWVLFRATASEVKGKSLRIPQEVVRSWNPRETQICPAEAFAVLAAIFNHESELEGRDIIVFVDNEAAAASLIRGASSSCDVGHIAQEVQWKILRLNARIWIEWVDSHSNPSDGLSRAGLLDEWTLKQNWALSEGTQPPWDFVRE
jgi:hypothetical protein